MEPQRTQLRSREAKSHRVAGVLGMAVDSPGRRKGTSFESNENSQGAAFLKTLHAPAPTYVISAFFAVQPFPAFAST